MTNNEFAEILGYHHSMASRIRSGERLPGVGRLRVLSRRFGISLEELLEAYEAGPATFGELVRLRVFSPPKAAAPRAVDAP